MIFFHFPSFLSPVPRLGALISEANIPFKTTHSTWDHCVADVTKLENLHCNPGKRLHDTLPSSSQPSFSEWQTGEPTSLLSTLKLESPPAYGSSLSHTRKPVLGKSVDSEMINPRVLAYSDSHQWLLIHICQIPYMPCTGRPPREKLHKENLSVILKENK